MKKLIIILLVLIGFNSTAQKDVYLITGLIWNGENVSDKVIGTHSTITFDNEIVPMLDIMNKFSNTETIGGLTKEDIPDKYVERTSTTYRSQLQIRKYQYYTQVTGHQASKLFTADVSIVIVEKPDYTYLDCTILTADNRTYKYSGYLIERTGSN